MLKTKKQKLIGVLMITILLLVILGMSIPRLQMEPGVIFSFQTSEDTLIGVGEGFQDLNWFIALIQAILLVLVILAPVHIIVSLLSKKGRRKLLSDIIKIALLFLIGMWLIGRGFRSELPEDFASFEAGEFGQFDFGTDGVTPEPFQANPQPWMVGLVILVGAIVIAGIVLLILSFLATLRPGDPSEFERFAENAQTALEAIEAEKIEFKNVIIQCYAEMSQTLRDENDIQRDQAMTTNEFERELLAKGFPAHPVHQLTQLFEQVRYGRHQPAAFEKQVAVESLQDIIDYCRNQA